MRQWAAAVLCTFIAGCGGVEDPEVGWRPLEGVPYTTPKYGITFYWVGAGGAYWTPEDVSAAIDRIYFEWLQFYEARFGFGLNRFQLLHVISRQKIQLFPGSRIRGNTTDPSVHTLGIYWAWEHQIDTAMGTPLHLDAWLGIYTEGLEQLKHEWLHVLRGASHDPMPAPR